MNKKSQRLEPIRDIARNKERKAVRVIAEKQAMLQSCRTRLESLTQYKMEYLSTFQQQGVQGLVGSQLQQYYGFIRQLEQAIEQQTQRVYQAKEALNVAKRSWKSENTRLQAISKAQQKFLAKEKKEQLQREQSELEESAFHAAPRTLL